MYLALLAWTRCGARIGVYRIMRRFLRRKPTKRRDSDAAAGARIGRAFLSPLRSAAGTARTRAANRANATRIRASRGSRLPDAPDGQPAGPLARRIVEAYYRVRFGRAALDSRQAAAVEQLLDQLQTAVSRPKRGRRRR